MIAYRRSCVLALAAAALLLGPTPAGACNIPVFRYALDHWPSDPYRITIFHRGPLAGEHREALQKLEKYAAGETPALVLELIDLEKTEGVPPPPAGTKLPHVVVQYPAPTRINAPVWTGPLTMEFSTSLLDSPARREIARRIRGGDSAVWVLLACGDKTRDDAAEKLLRAEVQRLVKDLKLPERTAAPEDALIDEEGLPLRLAFSILRVGRTDPAEQMLVQMMLNTEEDLPGRNDPMVFGAFGRGRVMPALIGAGITPENIADTAGFLVGPCSCQVKRDNPGVDLLVTAEWDRPAIPAPTAASTVAPGTTVPIPRPAVAPASESEPPAPSAAAYGPSLSPRQMVLAGIAVVGLIVVLTGTKLLFARRRGSQ